ncbi:MAG: aspartate/glutamate racemase family protein [Cyanobacteria bacterium P01_E01_bin.34]
MRIKVINGNTFKAMTVGIDTAAQNARSTGTDIVTVQPRSGPESIESYYDEYLAIPGILEEIRLSGDECDGFVIACWGDPGLEAARELISKPVVGIAEASMYVANMLAARWGVVTTGHRVRSMIEDTIHRTGFGYRCVSIRTTGLAVVETETARDATIAALVEAGTLAISEDGAEALCLGCAGMSGLDEVLQEVLGVPVIDSVAAAVKMAESLIGLQKRTSKFRTYAVPETKLIKGYPDHMQPG